MEYKNILNRFLNYVKIETTSDPNSLKHPSTDTQFNLAKIVKQELEDFGLETTLTDNCYLYGFLKSNSDKPIKSVGFISHFDTSSDASGLNVNPQIIKNYDEKKVYLNKKLDVILDPNEYPLLKNRVGETLITTDGTTLLGADDKAGISEIMTLIEYLTNNKDIIHGDIYVCFTPDEEIGEGTLLFNKDLFTPDYAYTVDGSVEGGIEYENFNAASCIVTINGKSIHPGSAKGHMINSIKVGYEFNSMLPEFDVPEYTENYEGFNHLCDINGSVEKTTLEYIIINHNKDLFNKQKQDFLKIQKYLNDKYGYNICNVEIKDSYYNMYDIIKDHMDVVNIAIDAIKKSNLNPTIVPIRGGTDGAQLTYKGIPCPNLGTGGENFHGVYEYITLEGMQRSVDVLVNIVNIISNK